MATIAGCEEPRSRVRESAPERSGFRLTEEAVERALLTLGREKRSGRSNAQQTLGQTFSQEVGK
jgi:hypothetical protein